MMIVKYYWLILTGTSSICCISLQKENKKIQGKQHRRWTDNITELSHIYGEYKQPFEDLQIMSIPYNYAGHSKQLFKMYGKQGTLHYIVTCKKYICHPIIFSYYKKTFQ